MIHEAYLEEDLPGGCVASDTPLDSTACCIGGRAEVEVALEDTIHLLHVVRRGFDDGVRTEVHRNSVASAIKIRSRRNPDLREADQVGSLREGCIR